MAYEIKETFSHGLVHSFLSRIGFLLNKIKQEQVNSYDCESFSWSYDTIEGAEGRTDCVLIYKPTLLTFKWNGERALENARIFVTEQKFTELAKSNTLEDFVKVEKHIMEHIIKKEKELLDALAFKMDIKQNK